VNSEARLRAFLADSLDLWRVEGNVEAAAPPALAQIRAQNGTVVSVERIPEGTMPFRWMVRKREPGVAREERPRPCGSLVGVLGAIRAALGVDRGTPVRIAPSPADE
jgi:hypothetical protein